MATHAGPCTCTCTHIQFQERACYLASNPAKEETLETERMSYTLPDGSSLDIGPAR